MLFKGLEIAITGMEAQRVRIDISSSNLSNVNSTRTENGEPYRRKVPVFEAVFDKEEKLTKVKVKDILD